MRHENYRRYQENDHLRWNALETPLSNFPDQANNFTNIEIGGCFFGTGGTDKLNLQFRRIDILDVRTSSSSMSLVVKSEEDTYHQLEHPSLLDLKGKQEDRDRKTLERMELFIEELYKQIDNFLDLKYKANNDSLRRKLDRSIETARADLKVFEERAAEELNRLLYSKIVRTAEFGKNLLNQVDRFLNDVEAAG